MTRWASGAPSLVTPVEVGSPVYVCVGVECGVSLHYRSSIKHSKVIGRGQVPYSSLKLTGGSVALRFTSLSLRMVPMSVLGRIGVP